MKAPRSEQGNTFEFWNFTFLVSTGVQHFTPPINTNISIIPKYSIYTMSASLSKNVRHHQYRLRIMDWDGLLNIESACDQNYKANCRKSATITSYPLLALKTLIGVGTVLLKCSTIYRWENGLCWTRMIEKVQTTFVLVLWNYCIGFFLFFKWQTHF